MELPGHPWFIAVQFHPEFKSKPLRPHPLFAGFVEASYRAQARVGSTPARSARTQVDGLTRGGSAIRRPRHGPRRRHRSPSAAARRWCSSPGRASSRASSTRSTSPLAIRDIAAAPAFRSSSRRRSTRPTARRSGRSGARARGRPAHAGRGAGASGRAGADRHPRAVAGRARGRGGRRAADPGVPVPADRPAGGGRAHRAGRSTSRRGSSSRRRTCGTPSRRSLDAATTACSLTERGTSFGYHNLVVDMRGVPDAAGARLPRRLRRDAQPAAARRRAMASQPARRSTSSRWPRPGWPPASTRCSWRSTSGRKRRRATRRTRSALDRCSSPCCGRAGPPRRDRDGSPAKTVRRLPRRPACVTRDG